MHRLPKGKSEVPTYISSRKKQFYSQKVTNVYRSISLTHINTYEIRSSTAQTKIRHVLKTSQFCGLALYPTWAQCPTLSYSLITKISPSTSFVCKSIISSASRSCKRGNTEPPNYERTTADFEHLYRDRTTSTALSQ